MAFKLRHYVPLFTSELIYYGMFNSILQCSLMNWGKASKCHLYRIKVFRNRLLRSSLFCKNDCSINDLYSTFGVLKLDDMIDMEHAKFLFRFNNNNILPDHFKNYFVKQETIHHYHTRQKTEKDFFHTFACTKWRRKMIQRKGLKKIPLELKNCSFQKFKQTSKKKIIQTYINTF